ncbi:MAG: SRPBCC family protein [Chloroflexi bacterium]|nr:SRPBCC family protein [Chloroflexota bacterium]
MAHVDESAIVPAPVEQVFAVIADYRRALEWMEGFTAFDLLPGPERGIGARVRAVGSLLGLTMESELEIVAYHPPHRLVSRSVRPVRSETAWELEPAGEGTRVRFTGDYSLPLALRIAGERAFQEIVSAHIRRSLANLRRLFEESAAGTGKVLE